MGSGRAGGTLGLLGLSLVIALAVAPVAPGVARAAHYDAPERVEADFQAGLNAMAAGDPEAAIRLFRAILAERPDLPRVRLELARAYFEAREWERSRREFFAVLSGGVPPEVKANILAFLQAIDARRGFDWTLSVGFAASPEASRNYDSDTVLVDVLGVPVPFRIVRETDGAIGIRASGSAEYRVELPALASDQRRVTAFGRSTVDAFEGDGSGADDYIVAGHLGLRGAWPRMTAAGSAFLSTRHFGGDRLEERFGAEAGVERRTISGLSLFVAGAGGIVDDHLSDLRDGAFGRVRAGLARSIGGRALAGVAVTAELLDAEADFESYATLGGELFGSVSLALGLDLSSRVYLLRQDYGDRIPGLFETRTEREYGVDFQIAKTDLFLFGSFVPYVEAGYSRRKSTLDAFSFHETRFEVGIQKAF